MTERWVVVLAVSTALAAWIARPIPLLLVVALVVIAVVKRNSALAVLASAAIASALSAHAWHELREPIPPSIDATGTIMSDPEVVFGETVAEIRVNGRHYQVWTESRALGALAAGQRVRVTGTTHALSGRTAPSLRRRHIVAAVSAKQIVLISNGNALARFANDFRRVSTTGSHGTLSQADQALLAGLVYGDDRLQSDRVQRQFRDSGLAHLSAVSGENVAFVLLLVAPALRRFRLTGRLVGNVIVLLLFGTITRWEPSVLRAEIMAVLVLTATWLGRPTSLLRNVGLGITVATLLDPFLVGSVGFLLSAAACVGMALLGERLSAQVPGPQWLKRSTGYSLAAQFGVLPVAISAFGGMPVVGVVANVLVEPVAGLAMMWGLGAGTLAGLTGRPVATLLHLPTRLMLWWIQAVAAHGASVEHQLA